MADTRRYGDRVYGHDGEINKRVASELVRIRKKVGMTQEEIAKAMGASRSMVAKIENAMDNLSLTKLVRYANALGLHEITLSTDETALYLIRRGGIIAEIGRLFLALGALGDAGTDVATIHEGVPDETTGSEMHQLPEDSQADETGPQDDSPNSLPQTPHNDELPLSP